MIAICRAKSTGKITRLVEFSNTRFIQEQLDEAGLNNNNYHVDYFFGEVERLKDNEDE
jgi:hypothetical protein